MSNDPTPCYDVWVGGLGKVWDGTDPVRAMRTFFKYCYASMGHDKGLRAIGDRNGTRYHCLGESVSLGSSDGGILLKYIGALDRTGDF